MYPYSYDSNSMDPFLDSRTVEPGPEERYLKQCNKCMKVFEAKTRTELFTQYGWHLRLVHYPEWGKSAHP